MASPPWLKEIRGWDGVREVPGPGVNARIRDLWLSLPGGAWFWKEYGSDDSKLPWCGAMMAGIMRACGIPFPAKYSGAREWLRWGVPLPEACAGAVAVFTRPGAPGSAHVGIIEGRNSRGEYMVWGGNQRDGVCLIPIAADRLAGCRWPSGFPLPGIATLPLIAGTAPASTNEA